MQIAPWNSCSTWTFDNLLWCALTRRQCQTAFGNGLLPLASLPGSRGDGEVQWELAHSPTPPRTPGLTHQGSPTNVHGTHEEPAMHHLFCVSQGTRLCGFAQEPVCKVGQEERTAQLASQRPTCSTRLCSMPFPGRDLSSDSGSRGHTHQMLCFNCQPGLGTTPMHKFYETSNFYTFSPISHWLIWDYNLMH